MMHPIIGELLLKACFKQKKLGHLIERFWLTLSLKTTAMYILKSNWSANDSRLRRSCDRKRLRVADFLEAGSAIWDL